MRYRIALCGFSEFEYRAMQFSFRHPAALHESQYDFVDSLPEADFAVVDADSQSAVKGVVGSGRLAQAVFVGAVAPAGATWHLQRPIDPTRILRALDQLTTRHAASAPKASLDPRDVRDLPTLDDVLVAPAAPSEPASAATPSPTASHRAAKTAARAAARRARQANERAELRPTEPLRDVLVLDADVVASGSLCTLLERFGFNAEAVASIAQADEVLATRAFAAIFLTIALDGSDHGAGLALLQRIHQMTPPQGHAAPAVLMVSAHLTPADRVRAALAGVGAPLAKPVSRGDVARALEGCGVTLPTDARRR